MSFVAERHARSYLLTCATCALIAFGTSALAWGSSTLNFPRLQFDAGTLTGVAFVNPTDSPATVTITAYGPDGSELEGPQGFQNPAQVDLPAFRQRALVLTEVFGVALPPDQYGWMQATSPVDGITGFFLYLNGEVTLFDGADLPVVGRKLLFARVRSGGGFSTEINVVNPGTVQAEVSSQLFVPGESPLLQVSDIVIPPKGVRRLSLAEVYGADSVPDGSYILLTSTQNVAGFELVRRSGQDLIGLNARPTTEGESILYFPQMAVLGPWVTHLGLVNLSDQAILVEVSAHRGEDGSLHSGEALKGANPTVVPLPAHGSLFEDVAKLFQFEGDETLDGWLKVRTDGEVLNGFVSYGLPGLGSNASVAGQPQALNRAIFSHIATDLGYFTGVALLNPGQLANPFRIMAFDIDTGQSLGIFDGVLQPGERTSRLIDEFVPNAAGKQGGFIWVKTQHPAYMTSLFGTAPAPDRPQLVLANIPPQISPPGYAPDTAQPALKVTPPLAVLQPGHNHQFNAEGPPGARIWRVNNQQGGADAIGTISNMGFYTAPGGSPAALPVTVSAEIVTDQGSLKGGASVDVLSKEVLFEGIGLVTSLAYLRSLHRLYAAELGVGPAGSGSSHQEGSSSSIRQVFPQPPAPTFDLPNRQVVKMIEYTSSKDPNKGYLLLCDRAQGEILRFDPAAGTPPVVVAGGFNSPNSIAIDPVGGTLLVADNDGIASVSVGQLEVGLASLPLAAAAGSSGEGTGERLQSYDVVNPRGIGVDACTGNLYVSERNSIVEINRLTQETRVVYTGESPGQILGLYRNELPCPSAFQILVSEPARQRVVLVDPSSDDEASDWIEGSYADIAYLPIEQGRVELGGPGSGILLGEVSDDVNQGALVPVPGLYVNRQRNIPLPVYKGIYTDPEGDLLTAGAVSIDLLEVRVEAYAGSSVRFELALTEPVLFRELRGFIDIDSDRNPETGNISFLDLFTPYSSKLGVDYRVDLGSFVPVSSPNSGTCDVIDALSGDPVGQAIVSQTSQRQDGSWITVEISANVLTISGPVNAAIVVGTGESVIDAAPNGGMIQSAFSTLGPY